MKFRMLRFSLALGIATLGALAAPGFLRAQAPAGPLPAAQPQTPPPTAAQPAPPAETRTTIVGQWRLNRDDSDDPQKKMQQARANAPSGGGSGVHIGGFPVGMGGGHGGYGGNRGESDAQREQTQELITPSSTLILAQKDPKDPEVDLFDDQNRKRAFFTDGRKLQKNDSKNDSYEEIAAHWDGARLVTDEKGPHGKRSRTFELSYDRTQLYETLRFTSGRSPVDIRYVYDPVSQPAAERNP